ncbi:glutathione S-transferase family protein [Variovorax paradoxus]|nr:glutathione S-transferase family protein [Variovorax paradoxus]MBT2305209.1 glutathione S-transferase family protein [Variovorax paradoxus]
MALELYQTPSSTCSQKVRLALAEKGLPQRGKDWLEHELNLGKFEQLEPDYLKLNPNGVVPTLLHGGAVIIESSVILEYLDEVFPQPPLVPADPVERARLRAWLRYGDEVPTAAVRVPSFTNVVVPMHFENADDEDFARHAERLPLRKQFYQRMTRQGFGAKDLEAALGQIRQTCERIEKAVGDRGGPWIMGEDYTLVEVQLTPLIDRMEDLGYAYVWESLPKMEDWWARIKARPSYGQAFYPGSRMSQRYGKYFRSAAELKEIRGF